MSQKELFEYLGKYGSLYSIWQERHKHKHGARRKHRRSGQQVENLTHGLRRRKMGELKMGKHGRSDHGVNRINRLVGKLSMGEMTMRDMRDILEN